MIITEDYNPTWLMLQTTTEGKKTSERGTVMVSTVVTTVAFMKSESLTDISYDLCWPVLLLHHYENKI